jgi:arylsulfatase A-like enzyme
MKFFSVFILLLAFGFAQAAPDVRPNIVFILADDLGGSDLGCYGSTFHATPHLDALAKRGMLFTQAYSASPLCSPTRSSILTGMAPARTGITAPACHVPQVILEKTLMKGGAQTRVLGAESVTRMRTEYVTLAELLKQAGYRTGHFGKWHLGPAPYSPLEQGFDVDLPHTPGPGPGGGNGYFAPWAFWKDEGKPGDHIEDRMAEEAVKFMRENKDRPFFLNYWAFSVHSPWMAKADYITEAAKNADPKAGQRNPMYAAMIRSLDEAVGRLTKTLDELKLTEKTLVVFTSDNGAWHNVPKEAMGKNSNYSDVPVTSNAPFRSGKASNYEGGTRVPLFIAWPGHVQPGSRSAEVVQSVDFFPTLLELCELQPPAGQVLDGVSIVPAMKGGKVEREAIFCHFPHGGRSDIEGFLPGTWVRRGDWKLIRFFAAAEDGSDRLELYNLVEDVSETKNLAPQKPELVSELNRLISDYLKKTEAVVPKLNPAYKAKGEPIAKRRAVGGWTSSKDARLELTKEGALIVECTGGDPWLATATVPQGNPDSMTVRIRLRRTAKGQALIYYSSSAGQPFHKDRTVPLPGVADGEWHEQEVVLPVKSLHSLRLDPAQGKGRVEISNLSLVDAHGEVLKEWLPFKN